MSTPWKPWPKKKRKEKNRTKSLELLICHKDVVSWVTSNISSSTHIFSTILVDVTFTMSNLSCKVSPQNAQEANNKALDLILWQQSKIQMFAP